MRAPTTAERPNRADCHRIDWRVTARVGGGLASIVLAVAVAVHAGWSAGARAWLRFRFDGLEATPQQASAIFATNARLLAAPFAAALVAQAPRLTDLPTCRGQLFSALRVLCDLLLSLAVAANLMVVGAALGGYGARMGAAMLPHGPLELLAFSLALAAYLRARHSILTVRVAIHSVLIGVAALGVAAVLETYVLL